MSSLLSAPLIEARQLGDSRDEAPGLTDLTLFKRDHPEHIDKGRGWCVVYNPLIQRTSDVNLVDTLKLQDCITSLLCTPDGSAVAIGTDSHVYLYSLPDLQLICQMEHHLRGAEIEEQYVYCLKFSLDGRNLLSGSEDGKIRIWDVASASLQRTIVAHQDDSCVDDIDICYEKGLIASVGTDKMFHLHDLLSGKRVWSFKGRGQLICTQFSPSGRYVAWGGLDKFVRVYEVFAEPKRVAVLAGETSGASHSEGVWSMTFISDQLLISGALDGSLRLWDMHSMTLLKSITQHRDGVLFTEFLPTQRWLISTSKDKTIIARDIATHEIIFCIHGHKDYIYSFSAVPNEAMFVSGSNDGIVKLWRFNKRSVTE